MSGDPILPEPPTLGTKPGDESSTPDLGLFEGFGVEIEYMIVDRETLDLRPVADRILAEVAEPGVAEVERGVVAWSNELVLHVLEMKTNGPVATLEGLHGAFHTSVGEAEALLEPLECRLLPGGAHPWMDPERETRIWPHEYTEVYRTFDRIFSCRGHGWANLQSTHLNLPFRGDGEFRALHSAVRLLLPLLPALAASTPILDGRVGSALDLRLLAYRENARRVPEVTGNVIPEVMGSESEYGSEILEAIYRALAPHDPEGVLRHEWVNARGAIARFTRRTIEIRTLDAQECPSADLGVVAAVVEVLRRLVARGLDEPEALERPSTALLARVLDDVMREGEQTPVDDAGYREALGMTGSSRGTAGELWWALLEGVGMEPGAPLAPWAHPLGTILHEGPLARRILRATGAEPDRRRLREVYGALADALREDRPFVPGTVGR